MAPATHYRFRAATAEDAEALAALANDVAQHLTAQHGQGHWSSQTPVKRVLNAIHKSQVLVAHSGPEIMASLVLSTVKPWAIDASYFSPCRCPLYLTGMLVTPKRQRRGLGRRLLEEAEKLARSWPADAIRLDAYDAAVGAGGFYARCGYTEVGRASFRNTPLIYYELILK